MRENSRHNTPYNNHNNHYQDRRESSPLLEELVEKEQAHRHKWQDKYLKTNGLSFRIGQIFGVVYNLALLALVYQLIQQGEKILAEQIFFGNLALIAFALLVTAIERKILSKKPPRRNRDKRFNKGRRDHHNRRDDHRHKNHG